MELSVVIPTKDRPSMLPRAVASVLDQAPQTQIVIIDDGSTPENNVLIRETYADDERVTIMRNEVSRGAPAARNQGLEVSEGRFWATLDDDNVWLPGKWDAQRALLADQQDDDVTVVCAVHLSHEPESQAVAPRVGAPERVAGTLGTLFRRVPPRCFVHSYVTSRALMEQVGGYDTRLVWGEHTDLMIRLAEHSRFAGTPFVGVSVVKDHGAERTGRNWRRKVEGVGIILDKHAALFAQDPVTRADYRHILGVSQMRAGDRRDAIRTLGSVVVDGPGVRRRIRAAGHWCVAVTGTTKLWTSWTTRNEGRAS